MKIVILGAAGQISRMLTDNLRRETDHEIVLFARNAERRLEIEDSGRETLIDGDFNDTQALEAAISGADIVYLNEMADETGTENIIRVMENSGVKRLVAASVLDIYDDVAGEFGRWNDQMIGSLPVMQVYKEKAESVEASDLDYTLLRLTWLYNEPGNEAYSTTDKGEPFVGAQVTRNAVARMVIDIIEDPSKYSRESPGVYEPGSEHMDKPEFY
ncbi:NAD(P)H-binding protein [Salinicoccus kekensis]|uniref:Putative NAD(P)-binding protein n=1 Tax=Salinicoccus kekensis TaxID=714307 RepID=A0A285UGY9_9STAP|nr:NAD(P)H-binding protein [Salinicoccus kekensis]SOC40668.1 putative NAD(P)-binding protein [Salinicoccus kekensis]